MTEQTRDGGVEECKGFSPPNVHTISASSTRLPLGSLDLNTRVPNTGTATPQRLRRTESQRSSGLAKKRQGTPREQKDSACMMLKKNVHRGAFFYNTWLPLVLLQVNTVVSR